ncbi:protein PaaC [[Actinobacillus] muris]|uniref:Protein PaaC n=1 Tax=Muribacter muris TaxID=67855 RepID=A0A0J5P7V8_9PAST|nr:DMT family transporter [Muribacter muris]KMK51584.1 protein PaaC [[Actinobacillus] muris] [Muribacter muris]
MLKSLSLTAIMALIWGSSFPFSKLAIDAIGPMPFRFITLVLSCSILFVLFYKEVSASMAIMDKQNMFKMMVVALPNILLVPTLNNLALYYTSVTNATILIYTMPCFTSVILMLMARKIDFLSVLAAVLCMLGVFFVLNEIFISLGEVIILSSALVWAVGTILAQKVKPTLSSKATLFWQFLFSALCLGVILLFALERQQWILPVKIVLSDLKIMMSLLYISVIGSALIYFIWFYLIKTKSAEFASYATLFSPLITLVIMMLFFDEYPLLTQALGFALILLSAVIINIVKPLLTRRSSG